MKLFIATSTIFFACLFSQVSSAATVSFDEFDDGFVKTVSGAWSYNAKIEFEGANSFSMSLTEFDLPENFTYLGAMISTTTSELAKITIKDGIASSVVPVQFDVGEEDYWISIFALTGSQFNGGTFGLDFFSGDVAEVPIPSAFIFMLSGLLGFFTLVRRRVIARSQL